MNLLDELVEYTHSITALDKRVHDMRTNKPSATRDQHDWFHTQPPVVENDFPAEAAVATATDLGAFSRACQNYAHYMRVSDFLQAPPAATVFRTQMHPPSKLG